MTHDDAQKNPGLATLFFRNRYLLWLSVGVILVAGFSSIQSLPRLEDPRIVNRGPLIVTPVPGASAERVESLVTEVLEEALDEIDAVKNLDSTSRAGVSLISVELKDEVDNSTNKTLFAEVRDKVAQARPLLPPDAGEPFVDDKREAAAFTLILGVTWDAPGEPALGVLDRLAADLADQLRTLPGTDLVRIYGGADEQITITLDRAELAQAGLSPAELSARVGAADAKRAAGTLRSAQADRLIEVAGELDAVERIARVPVTTGDGTGVLSVGDIADVQRGWRTPVDTVGLVDGRRSVLVAARASPDIRVDGWAQQADALVTAFGEQRAGGVRIDRVFEQPAYTNDRLATLTQNLLMGAGVILLAVFVIMGLRPAIVVASALPLVVSLVLLGWSVSGQAVHQMSIFGLIIALGLLIDNAIVMTDEVAARRARGAKPIDAVGGAVRHLFLPLMASTITTVLAFAPILLLPGGAGDFVGSIGQSVILAITASYGVALTLTASLAGLFIKPSADGERRWWRDGVSPRRLADRYAGLLRWLFARPAAAVALALALPAAGFAIVPTLGNQFFPLTDRNMFEVRVWLPSDRAVGSTRAAVGQVEQTLRSFDGVEHVSWLVGGSFPTVYYNLIMDQDGAGNYAHGVVTTDSPETTIALLDAAQQRLTAAHPEAQILVRRFAQGPPVVADIEYRIFGPSLATQQAVGDRFRAALQAHPDVLHTQATMPRGEPKLFFDADEDAARLAGMTLADISAQLEAGLDGAVAGSVLEGLEQMPVRVRFADPERESLDELAATPLVTGRAGQWAAASSLGDFALRPVSGGVTRFNGQRTNTIKAYVRNGALPIDISAAVLADLESQGAIPPGYTIGLGGAAEQDGESSGNLATFAPILGVMMLATLILVFRSLRYALVLAGVAVLSVGLAMLSTWAVSLPISFNTILGTLGLIGVALNDSVVVLAAIRADPRAAAGDLDAMVRSVRGSTRHILATTATTIGGFLPLLLFVGGDFWPSLAIVLVGGIAGATLIALLFIPAMHLLLKCRRRDQAVPVAA